MDRRTQTLKRLALLHTQRRVLNVNGFPRHLDVGELEIAPFQPGLFTYQVGIESGSVDGAPCKVSSARGDQPTARLGQDFSRTLSRARYLPADLLRRTAFLDEGTIRRVRQHATLSSELLQTLAHGAGLKSQI